MKRVFFIFCWILAVSAGYSQAPGLFNYQGVARNSVGNVIQNKTIALRLTIRTGTATGTAVYSETREVATNPFGLFNVLVGSPGARTVTGTLQGVNWASGAKFVQVEIDPEGGTTYINIGTSQLASVPYALFAANSQPGPTGPQGPAGPVGPQGPAGNINGVSAGGDLSGTYPNPVVKALNGRNINSTAPANGQVLRYNGTEWAPASISGGLVLPYSANENNASTLFSIRNAGTGVSLEGINASTGSSIAAVRGQISSTTPGGFSSAVRGMNAGTSGLGIGVWGSQDGSGWGVYGSTPSGLGVYGNSSGAGTGVYANSNTGIGLFAGSTNGVAGSFSISNSSNASNVMNVSTNGNGLAINAISTGNTAINGSSGTSSGAGVIGRNTDGGEAVVGLANSDFAGAVVGRNDGGGYGVRGFVAGNATGTGIGVLGQVGQGASTGRAGRFENINAANNTGNVLEVVTNGSGNVPDNTQGNAASFFVNNTNSVGAGVRGEVNTIFGNFGAAGIFGLSTGTGGFAGLFHAANTAGTGAALVSITEGNGNAITANAGKGGNGVETSVDGSGNSLYAWVPNFSTGRAGRFNNFNTNNTSDVITVTTVGNGIAGNFKVDRTNAISPAVKGEVNSIFGNFGTAGIYGLSSGTGGYAGLFYASNASGTGPAVLALAEGSGNAVTAGASNAGNGVDASVDGTGISVYGWVPNFGNGRAARFVNFNTANTNPALTVETRSNGPIAIFRSSVSAGNVARIDVNGRGYFNGGTASSGADLAEAFDVEGPAAQYEPGDVLVISTGTDRAVEKSGTPYSALVAGVYATRPGVLLTEEHIDSVLTDKVPMGVIGVIPTKVCMEGGPVKRGDMLVTSSLPGVAMKADPDKVKIGQVIGKALQDFDQATPGKIRVLVSIK